MPTLKEAIQTQSEWTKKVLKKDGFNIDGTISSLIDVDRFLTENLENGEPKKTGRLFGEDLKTKLFAVGAYVGEIIIKNVNGAEWITENNTHGELDISLKLPNGTKIEPIQKVMNRFRNEDTIYPYIFTLINEFIDEPFKLKLDPPKKRTTNFKILDIRKIEEGKYKLNEDYIFSYDYSDGWTERLLHVCINIDILFECKIEVRFSRDYRIKEEDRYFDKQFECDTPSEIKNKILEIMNLEAVTLKPYYSHYFMEDFGRKIFVINHGGVSHNTGIGALLKKLEPENPSEELFFALDDLLDKWHEELYQEFLKEY
ncbi:hypothetical protein GKZ90_0021995 [Flavobacterium sp. MC2016-06]|uniref:hypothetical protein n=1 Tax=Flavobacterium sp. MC2016-06 TaxID=2676308 RepID=UPI0012BAC0C5|nr:hypothetical protein [Flavobacterium sp. MC2016-06]MBU3861121.1 hypothetical protein [Flavobacterium sp. MC2016-06]